MFCDNSTLRENHKKKTLVDGKKKIGEKLGTNSVVQTACNWHRWFEKSRQGGGRYIKHGLAWCPALPPSCPLSALVSATANLGLIHKMKKKKKFHPFLKVLGCLEGWMISRGGVIMWVFNSRKWFSKLEPCNARQRLCFMSPHSATGVS